jgi:hypothetical protein
MKTKLKTWLFHFPFSATNFYEPIFVGCYCVQYTCTLRKSVVKNMLQLIGNEVIKFVSLFSCFRYKRPTTGHRFGWVLTLFIKCWKNNFTFSTCVLYLIVSRAVRVQGWPGLKLSCDLGSGLGLHIVNCQLLHIVTPSRYVKNLNWLPALPS